MSTYQGIANNFLEQKKYQEAIIAYLDSLQHEPDDGMAYQGLAQCYIHLKKYDEAFSASNKAISLNSNLAIPHLVLAYIYQIRRNFNEALAEAQTAYNLAPELEDVGNSYGALLLSNGKLDESILVLKDTLENHPKSLLAHQNLSVAYREKRDYKKHVEETKLILRYNPTFNNAIWLFAAYQQQYAFWVTLITLASLVGALLFTAEILLIIPTVVVVQGLFFDLKYIIDGRWKRHGKWKTLLFSLITDCVLGVVTYRAFLMLNP